MNPTLQDKKQFDYDLVNHVPSFKTKPKLLQQQADLGNFIHFHSFPIKTAKNSWPR